MESVSISWRTTFERISSAMEEVKAAMFNFRHLSALFALRVSCFAWFQTEFVSLLHRYMERRIAERGCTVF